MQKHFGSALLVALGWISLAVGIVGIFLPLLPTVPFVIAAAFFFSKGSPELHEWLRNHKRFGASLRSWQDHGVIRLRAKLVATVAILISGIYPLWLSKLSLPMRSFVVITLAGVLLFIWTRPNSSQ